MTAWLDHNAYSALWWLSGTYIISLHAAVYLAGVAVAAWVMGRFGPQYRASAWGAGILGLLAVTYLCHLPSSWSMAIVPRGLAAPMLDFSALEMTARELDASAPGRGAAWLRWIHGLRMLWMTGAALVVARIGRDWWCAHRMSARAVPLTQRSWEGLLEETRAACGVRRTVRLKRSGEISTPLTWGFLAPIILVPDAAEAWPDEARRAVLLHEMEHVRRLDCPLFTVSLFGAAWFWFHPAVWWALAQWRAVREEACDRAVIASGVRPSGYASLLLQLATPARLDGGSRTLAVSAGIARSSRLHRRIVAVLDAPSRPARTRRLVLAAMLQPLAAWAAVVGNVRAWPSASVMLSAAHSPDWRDRYQGAEYLLEQARRPEDVATVRRLYSQDPSPEIRRLVAR